MSGDWPDYVCSQFNDGFVAYLTSAALSGGTPANVATDTSGNPVSVNASSLPVCTPGTPLGCANTGTILPGDGGTSVCASGPGSLSGTGFGLDDGGVAYCTTVSTSGGGTNWLTTTAPVQPGELMTLELIIWDTGDASWDSSVLLDTFRWLPSAAGPITVPSP